jgi:hypothetical protein
MTVGPTSFRSNVLRSDLNDAWLVSPCGREYGAEIEFMSQDHKFLLCGIHHNFFVWSIRATNL